METINCQLRPVAGIISVSHDHVNCYIRKQKNLNQLKVALDLNISREALSHYENGKRSPDIEMLKKLSAYFDVSIDFLINGKEFKER